jgi:hypothetical protein
MPLFGGKKKESNSCDDKKILQKINSLQKNDIDQLFTYLSICKKKDSGQEKYIPIIQKLLQENNEKINAVEEIMKKLGIEQDKTKKAIEEKNEAARLLTKCDSKKPIIKENKTNGFIPAVEKEKPQPPNAPKPNLPPPKNVIVPITNKTELAKKPKPLNPKQKEFLEKAKTRKSSSPKKDTSSNYSKINIQPIQYKGTPKGAPKLEAKGQYQSMPPFPKN